MKKKATKTNRIKEDRSPLFQFPLQTILLIPSCSPLQIWYCQYCVVDAQTGLVFSTLRHNCKCQLATHQVLQGKCHFDIDFKYTPNSQTRLPNAWVAAMTSMRTNNFKTLRLRNTLESFSKHFWNTNETLVKHCLKHWWKTGETLVKQWWNTGETLVKHWWNTGDTLVKHLKH